MNSARKIARCMRAICFCAVIYMTTGHAAAFEAPPAEAGSECRSYMDSGESPHAMAIRLVMTQRAHEIAALDARDEETSKERSAWFDTRKRTWTADRLIPAGYIDTSHSLDVTYLIDDVPVAEWFVDLAAQRVYGTGEGKDGRITPCRS